MTEEVKTKDGTRKTICRYAAGMGIVQFAADAEDGQVVMGLAALEMEK